MDGPPAGTIDKKKVPGFRHSGSLYTETTPVKCRSFTSIQMVHTHTHTILGPFDIGVNQWTSGLKPALMIID